MAKLSDLVLMSSRVTGIPVGTVREVSRRLREAGLIRSGKGGRYGGAEMMPRDAAALITGLLIVRASGASINEIARRTNFHLRDLKSHRVTENDRMRSSRWDRSLGLARLCGLPAGHTFGKAFTSLITSISDGEFEQATEKWALNRLTKARHFSLRVEVSSTPSHLQAKILFQAAAFGELKLFYFRPRDAKSITAGPQYWSSVSDHYEYYKEDEVGDPILYSDLHVNAYVRQEALKGIARLLTTTGAGDA
jgi:hypothetical protein